MKTKLFFALGLFAFSATAQRTSDPVFIFKSYLMLNDGHVYNSEFEVRDSTFFNVAFGNTLVSIDTLPSEGFPSHFLFLQINVKEAHSVSYINRDLPTFSAGTVCSNGFVIMLDTRTGFSCRISGFNQTDILSLYREMRVQKLPHTRNYRQFVRNYSLEGIDLLCLLKAAKSKDYDPKKYPCSQRCNDMITMGRNHYTVWIGIKNWYWRNFTNIGKRE